MSAGQFYTDGPGDGLDASSEREVGFGDIPRVLWSPVDVLARVARQRRVLLGLAVVALWAALGLLSALVQIATGAQTLQLQSRQLQNLPPETRQFVENAVPVLTPVFGVLFPFVFWFLIAGLVYLAGRVLGGRGAFTAVLAVVGVALLPNVIGSIVGIPLSAVQGALGTDTPGLGLLSLILSIAVLAWVVALVIIGTRFAHGLSYGQSSGACALSCGGCLGLSLLLLVGIVALAAVLGGSSG
jgi:hypothetical protein